ncbi:MAG: leucine-rich repeat protein, partial [Clostridia bacterium]|nr:leucine-rich repeat protein [Clostridia bacterium]
MKRIIAMLLCTIMICSTLPIGALAATVVASGKAGDGISWSLDSDGHLRLWGSGETYNFAYYDYPVPWREYRTDIKTVTVGEGITVLHQNTFGGCSNMTELTLPTTLTDITGNVTFSGCNNLKKVHISDLDAWCRMNFGLVQHQEAACPLFSGADLYLNGEAVTEIVIPDGVTTMWSHQYSFPSLEKITLPDSMTTVSAYTLKRCKNVEVHISSLEQWLEIDFRLIVSGPLDNNSTLYIDGEPLTALTVPDGITSIPKSAFFGYDKLTYLDLNDVVTVGEYAFYKCEGLTTLDMAEAETLQDSSFYGCDGLKEIYISPKLKDAEGLRNSAENVEKVYIRDLYAFCTTTGTINSLYYGDEFGLYYNGELFTHLEVPEGIENFNNRAFADYERLESVTFPEGTTEIGASSFSYCKMLKEVDLPDTLTTIGKNAFYNTSLTSVDIPDGVEHISEGAFDNIDEMTAVDLPDNCITIGDYAFSGNSIESIEFPDTLTSIGRSAFDYNELKEVTIPDSVTYIGEYAFEGNRDLVIYCSIGSCADRYATANGITVRYTTQSKSVKVNTLPDKTVYNVYDTFDPTGLSLEVELDD